MDRADPVDILARTVWGEARGEFYTGMAAVAAVVMNRVAKPGWWGNDALSVCLCPEQFSCWNADDPNLAKLQGVDAMDPQFTQCLRIAADAVAGRLLDPTAGATSYFDRRMSKSPYWAVGKTPCATVGHHIFYRL